MRLRSVLLSRWHCPCCARDWSLNVFTGQDSTRPAKYIHVPRCYKTIKYELKIPLASLEEKLSKRFVFYRIEKTKCLIILRAMPPGRLKLGELGHSNRISHHGGKFPVGAGRLASLWKTLLRICPGCHLKFMNSHSLDDLHEIQSPGAMGK